MSSIKEYQIGTVVELASHAYCYEIGKITVIAAPFYTVKLQGAGNRVLAGVHESRIKRWLPGSSTEEIKNGMDVIVPFHGKNTEATVIRIEGDGSCLVRFESLVLRNYPRSQIRTVYSLCPLGCNSLIKNHCPIEDHATWISNNGASFLYKPGDSIEYAESGRFREGKLRGMQGFLLWQIIDSENGFIQLRHQQEIRPLSKNSNDVSFHVGDSVFTAISTTIRAATVERIVDNHLLCLSNGIRVFPSRVRIRDYRRFMVNDAVEFWTSDGTWIAGTLAGMFTRSLGVYWDVTVNELTQQVYEGLIRPIPLYSPLSPLPEEEKGICNRCVCIQCICALNQCTAHNSSGLGLNWKLKEEFFDYQGRLRVDVHQQICGTNTKQPEFRVDESKFPEVVLEGLRCGICGEIVDPDGKLHLQVKCGIVLCSACYHQGKNTFPNRNRNSLERCPICRVDNAVYTEIDRFKRNILNSMIGECSICKESMEREAFTAHMKQCKGNVCVLGCGSILSGFTAKAQIAHIETECKRLDVKCKKGCSWIGNVYLLNNHMEQDCSVVQLHKEMEQAEELQKKLKEVHEKIESLKRKCEFTTDTSSNKDIRSA